MSENTKVKWADIANEGSAIVAAIATTDGADASLVKLVADQIVATINAYRNEATAIITFGTLLGVTNDVEANGLKPTVVAILKEMENVTGGRKTDKSAVINPLSDLLSSKDDNDKTVAAVKSQRMTILDAVARFFSNERLETMRDDYNTAGEILSPRNVASILRCNARDAGVENSGARGALENGIYQSVKGSTGGKGGNVTKLKPMTQDALVTAAQAMSIDKEQLKSTIKLKNTIDFSGLLDSPSVDTDDYDATVSYLYSYAADMLAWIDQYMTDNKPSDADGKDADKNADEPVVVIPGK